MSAQPARPPAFSPNAKRTNGSPLALGVPEELVTAVVEQVVDLLAERLPNRPEPWLDSAEAAEYLRCDAKRISDLVRSGRLRCARDGRRLLFRQAWLDDCLETGGE